MATQTMLVHLDLGKNELQNAILQNLATDPNGTLGQFYYNTASSQIKLCTATGTPGTWVALGTGSGSGTVTTLTAGSGVTFSSGATLTTTGTISVDTTVIASKSYVDGLVQGLKWKNSVKGMSNTNATLASAFTNNAVHDGVTFLTGDRILIAGQTAPAENGIYTINASGAPTRALEADTWAELVSACVFVEQGTLGADTAWVCTADAGGTLGTTAINWVKSNANGTANSLTFFASPGGVVQLVTSQAAGAASNVQVYPGPGWVTSTSTLSGNVSGTAANVTGVVASVNGGTGSNLSTAAAGSYPWFSSTGLMGAQGPFTANGVILGNGASGFTNVAVGAANTVLRGSGTAPTFGQIVNADITNATIDLTTKVTGTLPLGNGGTGATSAFALPGGFKVPVNYVATGNINIASPGGTFDGVAVSAGARLLLTAQTTSSQNGIWDWNGAAVALTRPLDYPSGSTAHAKAGMLVYVTSGNTLAGSYYAGFTSATYPTAITIDSSSTLWSIRTINAAISLTGIVPIANGGTNNTTLQGAMNSFAGAVTSGQYLRGNGTNVVMSAIQAADIPTLNQNTSGTAGGLSATLTVSSGGTGATTLTGYVKGTGTTAMTASATIPGTDISGNIGGNAANVTGTVAVGNGGTGYTSGYITRKVTGDCTAAVSQNFTHSLGLAVITDLHVQVYEKATPYRQMIVGVQAIDANTVQINFNTAPTAAQYRIVVIG